MSSMRHYIVMVIFLAAPLARSAVDFSREVQPIIAEKCFACHGPDAESRKAKLRLDLREGATAKREDSQPAIVPGDPDHSEMIARITSPDDDERMPPAKKSKRLTTQQIDTLRRWIAEGAPWGKHWSFVAPLKPPLPKVKQPGWVRNPIDAFILAKLEESGLSPAPEADRRTLARRACFDLTGLPPKPADVEAFIADIHPDAYERFVDKCMAGPEWGEHRGRYWLDAARYGDTHGIHMDNYREMWPYRDWVIKAFNQNMPFDRFVVEQLAGDLLPNRTLDDQIASGFQRCNITTAEGGSINEEVLVMYAKDRTETTGTVFLGLTVGCANCHDHKFDPIKQKEFYQLAAYFRNNTQAAMDGNASDTPPNVIVPAAGEEARWAGVQKSIPDLKQKKAKRLSELKGEFEQWLAQGEAKCWVDAVAEEDQVFAPELAPRTVTSSAIEWKAGRNGGKAMFFKDVTPVEFAAGEKIDADQPLTWAGWIWLDKQAGNHVVASKLNGKAKGKSHGWKLEIRNGVPVLELIGESSADSISLDLGNRKVIPEKQWAHLAISYDGSRSAAGLLCYVNGKLIGEEPGRGNKYGHIKGSIRNSVPLRLGGDGAGNFKASAIGDFKIYGRELTPEEIEAVYKWDDIRAAMASDDPKAIEPAKNILSGLYAAHFDATFARDSQKLLQDEIAERDIRSRSAITLVMQERDNSKPTAHVLYRGLYDQPREQVDAGVPAALPPLPKGAPNNRLGLAQWIIAPENPLFARVTVNRFWQECFGTGIVRTSEDFGNTGEQPSNQALLDYLAIDFRESGWDVKRLFRLMVTSAAYRQSAAVTPEKLAKDPLNRLISRGPRFRMDAEMVRDMALASSGLLVRKIGGPSVKPYQPDNVWEAVAMFGSNTRFYKRDTGESLYRRSMYWFWKRSAPPTSLEIFNAPSREVCTVRRERADTPLQALVTMNDVQFVEAARALAQNAIHAGGDTLARLDHITLAVLSRRFTDDERRTALASLAKFESRFGRDEELAKKLLTVGDTKPDPAIKPSELAAWTMVASQILNLDEALNK
jgi:cytochrome c553